MRFFAASLVLVTHVRGAYDHLGPFGAFGVDVFFVLSGFIISYITEADTRYFILRRVVRIVPLYWFFTICILTIALMFPGILRSTQFDLIHFVSSMFFFPYWTEATSFSPLLKLGWTLNHEMLFYVLFFLSMRISHRFRELVCASLLLCIVLAATLIPSSNINPIEFYGGGIALEFALGMAVAVIYRNENMKAVCDRIGAFASSFLVFAAVCVFFIVSGKTDPSNGILRCCFWGGTATLVLMSVLTVERHISNTLTGRTRKWALFLGEVSYPLYLVHMYVLAMCSRVFKFLDLNALMLFLVVLVVSVTISAMINRFLDFPFRFWVRRKCGI